MLRTQHMFINHFSSSYFTNNHLELPSARTVINRKVDGQAKRVIDAFDSTVGKGISGRGQPADRVHVGIDVPAVSAAVCKTGVGSE